MALSMYYWEALVGKPAASNWSRPLGLVGGYERLRVCLRSYTGQCPPPRCLSRSTVSGFIIFVLFNGPDLDPGYYISVIASEN